MTISQDDLKKLVSYDPETGLFRSLGFARGKVFDCKNGAGYIQMTLNKQFYYGHRLAWFYVHGEWPKYIDHINGDKGDNRLENLRPATHSQNLANAKLRCDSTSGLKGVCKITEGRWKAQIQVLCKRYNLGFYDTKEQAHKAYLAAAAQHFGEYSRAA
jgi:hypothetical protein